jgi:hypothetical protein
VSLLNDPNIPVIGQAAQAEAAAKVVESAATLLATVKVLLEPTPEQIQ